MPTASSRRRRHRGLSTAQLHAVAERFRVLSVPSRLAVLNALMDGPLSMGDLEAATGLSQSNLSRQVTELERAGCVGRERSGREVTVAIVDPTLQSLCELVCGALEARASAAHVAMKRRR